MKKTIISLLMVAMGWQLASADIHNDAKFVAREDSFSTEIGENYGSMMAKVMAADKKMDKAEFIKGFNMVMDADTSNTGFMYGISVAMQYYEMARSIKQQSGINLNRSSFVQGFKHAVEAPVAPDSVLNAQNAQLRTHMTALSQEIIQDMAATNSKAGADYMAKTVKADKAYKTTASGLAYKVIAPGHGTTFTKDDKVRLLYEGKHINGEVFDASKDTVAFEVGKMVQGFSEALTMMRPGSEMQVIVPANLAYGDKGAGRTRAGKWSIEPGETLIFNISTFGVEKPASEKPASTTKPAAPARPKK